eukprot:13413743-Heterocapsa_arctica.AAC.1
MERGPLDGEWPFRRASGRELRAPRRPTSRPLSEAAPRDFKSRALARTLSAPGNSQMASLLLVTKAWQVVGA